MSDTSETSNQTQEQLASPTFRALRITAPNLDAEQRMYNALLDELDAATQALESLKLLQEAHSQERDKKLRSLEQQARQLYSQIVEQLEQRLLNPTGLSKKHLADIESVARAFSKVFNLEENIADEAPAAQDNPTEHQEAFEQTTLDTRAAREAAKQTHQARRQQAKQATKSSSAANFDTPTTPELLRNMYRKLASALHPDRASSETERAHKTALMGQVNAANDAQDLLTLLRLQQQTQSSDTLTQRGTLGGLSISNLKQTNKHMQAQIKALQHELQLAQASMQEQWSLPYGQISAKSLQMALRKEAQELTTHIAHLQSDVLWLADDAFLKNWLSQWGTE